MGIHGKEWLIMVTPNLFWKLFKSTGSISFYLMYRYFRQEEN
jgi:hypothetical protein